MFDALHDAVPSKKSMLSVTSSVISVTEEL